MEIWLRPGNQSSIPSPTVWKSVAFWPYSPFGYPFVLLLPPHSAAVIPISFSRLSNGSLFLGSRPFDPTSHRNSRFQIFPPPCTPKIMASLRFWARLSVILGAMPQPFAAGFPPKITQKGEWWVVLVSKIGIVIGVVGKTRKLAVTPYGQLPPAPVIETRVAMWALFWHSFHLFRSPAYRDPTMATTVRLHTWLWFWDRKSLCSQFRSCVRTTGPPFLSGSAGTDGESIHGYTDDAW